MKYKSKIRKELAAENVAVATAKDALRLTIENEIYKGLLKASYAEITYLRGVVNEAICYCETKKAQKKRSTAWLDEVVNEL